MPDKKVWKEHEGEVLDSKDGIDVIECEGCGFKHIVPIPSKDELSEVYRSDYYSSEKPGYFDGQREDLDWWNMVYAERFDTFEVHLASDRRRILDVGSGPGFFLLHGQERGWKTLGIEPSLQAAGHARGLGVEVVEAFFDDELASTVGLFDAAHMSEVLEHIPDPKNMLKRVANVLAPGGMICVSVPNDYNPFQTALRNACGYQPWWVAPPHHINYFSFDSLDRLLETCGFEVVLREGTFPIDLFLLMGDNYVGNDVVGRRCHGKRKTLEMNLGKAGMGGLKRELYRAMAEFGVGRESIIFGIKA